MSSSCAPKDPFRLSIRMHQKVVCGSRLRPQVQRQELDALRQQHDAMVAAADEAVLERQASYTRSLCMFAHACGGVPACKSIES